MINSCKIIFEKKNIFSKNHCEIQVRPIIVCALYSIKYGKYLQGMAQKLADGTI
jgi:hypothetical protein